MSLSAIPRSLRIDVFVRDSGTCRYCRLRQFGQGATFHVNHVIPRSRGGATSIDNLVVQCPYCSLHKANKLTAINPETGEEVRLFHPLEQRWEEHFVVLVDGACEGLTNVGKATVVALFMNDPLPKAARAIQLIFMR